MKVNLLGPSYQGRSTFLSGQRMVNLYPEISAEDSKSIAALIGTPGTSVFAQVNATNVVRGMHVFNNVLYFVASNKLYSVSSTGVVSAQLGSNLTTSTGRVVMADNGLSPTGGDDLIIADGAKLYNYDVVTTTWTQVDLAASTVCFLGGYFIADIGQNQYQVSGLYDGASWNVLDKSTADALPDTNLSVFNNHGELWLFCLNHTEVWYHSGSGSPPFARISGGVLDYGCIARHSVAKGHNSVLWLATVRNGDTSSFYGVVMANGYSVQKISTPAIEYQISQYTTLTDAFGYCYTEGGHEFYVLTFPTDDHTWCYDISTGFWHERSAYQGSTYTVGRHVGNCYAFFNNKHYIGDYASGNIYQMSSDMYTDSLTEISSWAILPYLYDKEGMKNIFIHRFQLDAEVGVRPYSPFVTIGYGSNIAATSSDGVTWTQRTLPANTTWTSVSWNGNVYCAVASGGNIAATSPDGVTWTQRTLPANRIWSSITWNGIYFIVTEYQNNKYALSYDGITWLEEIFSSNNTWQAVTSGGSTGTLLVAVAMNSNVASYSPNGLARWQDSVLPISAAWSSIAWNGSVFCAVASGPSNIAATSPDGITWTQRTLPANQNWSSIAWNGSVFCAVAGATGSPTNIAATSPDGITWTQRTLPANAVWQGISWNGQTFCAVSGTASNVAATSVDGTHWTQQTLPVETNWSATSFSQNAPNPTVALSWSDDGGNTWSNDHYSSMGNIQAYSTRMYWHSLGITRGRSFRIACTAAVKKVFIGATVEYTKGRT